jgi:hypothetical protein
VRAPLLAIIGIVAFGWCWHLVLNELEWRLRSRRMWKEIKRQIE